MYDGLSPGTHAGHCPSAAQVDEWRKEDDEHQEQWRRQTANSQCFGCQIDVESDCKSNQGLFEEEVQCFERKCVSFIPPSLSIAAYVSLRLMGRLRIMIVHTTYHLLAKNATTKKSDLVRKSSRTPNSDHNVRRNIA